MSLFGESMIRDQIIDSTHLNILMSMILSSNNSTITTHSSKLISSPCRLWQLIFVIFFYLSVYNPEKYKLLLLQPYQLESSKKMIVQMDIKNQTIEGIRKIISSIQQQTSLPLYQIIFNNNNFNTNGTNKGFLNIK